MFRRWRKLNVISYEGTRNWVKWPWLELWKRNGEGTFWKNTQFFIVLIIWNWHFSHITAGIYAFNVTTMVSVKPLFSYQFFILISQLPYLFFLRTFTQKHKSQKRHTLPLTKSILSVVMSESKCFHKKKENILKFI